MMELWRRIWRDGFVPQFSTAGLLALRTALADDDPTLLQGGTTTPLPFWGDLPVEAACATAYPFWRGDDLATVGAVETAFARACFNADQTLGEPAVCRHFLNWFDSAPREGMRRELLAEVTTNLAARDAAASPLTACPAR